MPCLVVFLKQVRLGLATKDGEDEEDEDVEYPWRSTLSTPPQQAVCMCVRFLF